MSKMEKSLRNYLTVFFTFFKISLFTFGGGYTMLSLLQNELVNKKKWIEENEFLTVASVAESTPGPIAINCATYVGHKLLGFFGSLLATFAIVIPSFVIIFIISLFFDKFLEIELIAKAFMGIKAAVAVLIIAAGVRMTRKSKKTIFSIILFILTAIAIALINFFAINFSTIYLIIIGGIAGLFVNAIIGARKNKKNEIKEEEDNDLS